MWELTKSVLLNSSITISFIAIIYWISKSFILEYLSNSVSHQFNKKIETFKDELQERRQEQQHFHELLLHTVSQENKELQSRKIMAADHLWKCVLAMKKFSIAVKFLGTLNFEEIKKRSADQKIQNFLRSFPKCSYAELLKEAESTTEQTAELARPWITHKAWALYLAYSMVIYYAVTEFESAKLGGELDSLFDEKKLLEIIQNALPDLKIEKIFPSLLYKLHDLLELTLLIELKNTIENKEDLAAIERTKKIFEVASEIKTEFKLKNISSK